MTLKTFGDFFSEGFRVLREESLYEGVVLFSPCDSGFHSSGGDSGLIGDSDRGSLVVYNPLFVLMSVFSRSLRLASLALATFVSGVCLHGEAVDEIRFNQDIRAILSDKCYACHGPDKSSRKGDLRLDVESLAKADRDGYAVIDVEHPEQSELLVRITTDDEDDVMPPRDSGKALTEEEIQTLKRWIENGADWEGHWAYIPPVKVPVPDVKNIEWRRSAVDRFIGARLESEGLQASKPADRRTLIRRVFLDLTGLPPSAEEVAAFEHDRDRFAFEHVVDQLLASPHFGERMAVYWLDLVRYADTVGYHGDQDYSVWPYRDYVIDAFNQNVSFDQFTREQLAGDLLADASRRQKVASGYNRLHMITAEGGAQDKEYLAKYAADRVRTTSSVWLGSTMGCAECHDHKFDPFTTKDFYSFAAFFSDLKERGFYGGNRWEPQLPLPSKDQSVRMASLDDEIRRLESTLTTSTEALVNGQFDWEAQIQDEDLKGRLLWAPVAPTRTESQEGARLRVLADQSVLVSGKNPKKDVYFVDLPVDREAITGIRLEALTHPSLDKESLSRGGGNFVLTDFKVERLDSAGEPVSELEIHSAKADFSQGGFDVSKAIDADDKSGWAVDGSKKVENRKAVFAFKQAERFPEGAVIRVSLAHQSKHERHNLGRFRLSVISIEKPGIQEIGLPTDIYRAAIKSYGERSESENELLTKYYREQTPLLDGTRLLLANTKGERDRLKNEIPTMLVSQSVKPRQMRVLPRGNWLDESGELVSPQIPGFLANEGSADSRLSRLDLAEWMVSESNPLTARTFVNRMWKTFFGTGLSKVLDDVGSQGEWPTHPELLDWLAVEFMESGWDVKHLVKTLVTSQAYRQSSVASDYLKEKDPFNRLYARQSAFRLDAEVVRDVALSVSGLRVDEIGGPSVKPYQPAGYYAQLNFPTRTYQADRGADQYRRGVYTHWQRTFLHPSMKAFDAPSREECTAERPRSNTPLQSLTLLNDPSYVEAARVFAERIMGCDSGDIEDRIRWAFSEAVCRKARASEVQILQNVYSKSLERFLNDTDAASELIGVGLAPSANGCPPAELAAWTMVSRTILNLHELITRY